MRIKRAEIRDVVEEGEEDSRRAHLEREKFLQVKYVVKKQEEGVSKDALLVHHQIEFLRTSGYFSRQFTMATLSLSPCNQTDYYLVMLSMGVAMKRERRAGTRGGA